MVLALAGCAHFSLGEFTVTVGKGPVAVAIGDVNGDGRNDVVTANARAQTVTALLQGANGTFSTKLTLALPGNGTPTAIAVGHFSSKRRDDIVVAEKGTDTLVVFAGARRGERPTQTISLAPGSAPSALAVADLKGNGYDDLAVATHAPAGVGCVVKGCVLVFEGGATGLRAQLTTIGLGTDAHAAYDPVALAFGHYFGGAHTDLAVADLANNRVLFVPGTGPTTFALDPGAFASIAYTHPTQLVDDRPDGKVEIGGGTSCELASPTGTSPGPDELTLIANNGNNGDASLCMPAVWTPKLAFVDTGGFGSGSLSSRQWLNAWNPGDGSSTLAANMMLLRSDTELQGATAVAAGQLVSEWGADDLAFVYPAQDKVLLALAAGTLTDTPTKLSFAKVASGSSKTKTFTGQVDGVWPVDAKLLPLITGKDAGQFKATLTLVTCGAAESSCGAKVAVTFTPTSTGTKTATLRIATDGEQQIISAGYAVSGFPFAPFSIRLSGQGTAGATGSSAGSSISADEPAPPGAGVPFSVGVTDDAGKFAGDGGASFYSDVRDLRMGVVRESVLWRGEASVADSPDRAFLDRSLPVAKANGVRVILAVYPATATSHDPTAFCQFANSVVDRYDTDAYGVHEYVIGNEPNQDLFWQPQIDGSSGASLSAASYEDLLSTCYRLIKPAHPDAVLAGAALNTNGTDRTGSHTSTSPVRFIQGMAAEYKKNNETGPIMDVFAFHAYPVVEGNKVFSPAYGYDAPNASIPNLGRLRATFDQAFAGTGQPLFSTGALHFLIDEVGWQTQIPAAKASLYTGVENSATVDEQTQAAYLARLVDGYACDGSVTQLLLFHLVDETQLNSGAGSGGWQSGLEYADYTHKPSYAVLQAEVAKGRAACNPNAFDKP